MARVRVPLLPASARWLIVALVAGGILVASVTRPTAVRRVTGPFGVLGVDKYLHFLAYAGFALVLAYALAGRTAERIAVVVFLAAVSFGLFVELLQLPLAYRTFSLADAAANATGATVVAVCWRPLRRRVRFRPVTAPRAEA
jgi:VanZ family protein